MKIIIESFLKRFFLPMLSLFSLANCFPYSVYLWTIKSQFSTNLFNRKFHFEGSFAFFLSFCIYLFTRFSLSRIDCSTSFGTTRRHLVNNDDWFALANGCAILLKEKESNHQKSSNKSTNNQENNQPVLLSFHLQPLNVHN